MLISIELGSLEGKEEETGREEERRGEGVWVEDLGRRGRGSVECWESGERKFIWCPVYGSGYQVEMMPLLCVHMYVRM